MDHSYHRLVSIAIRRVSSYVVNSKRNIAIGDTMTLLRSVLLRACRGSVGRDSQGFGVGGAEVHPMTCALWVFLVTKPGSIPSQTAWRVYGPPPLVKHVYQVYQAMGESPVRGVFAKTTTVHGGSVLIRHGR